jgi:hypothetical protein
MAKRLLSLIRPAYETTEDLAMVASQARNDPETAPLLEQQIAFDDKVVAELNDIRFAQAKVEPLARLLTDGTELAQPASTEARPVRSEEIAHLRQPSPTSLPPPARPDKHLASTTIQVPPTAHTAELADAKEQEEEEETQPRHAQPRTIFFAVGIGLIATICMLVWAVSDQMHSFAGSDQIVQLLDSANGLNGNEFEPVEATARDLEDWFFLKHGLEHYAVPKEFADAKTIGCRIFKFNGTDVAQIMAVGDKEMLFYLFPSSNLGVKVRRGKWAIVDGEKWVGGVTAMKDTCFVVAFHGTQEEMKKYLAKKQ